MAQQVQEIVEESSQTPSQVRSESSTKPNKFIDLENGRDFSRILYTNPVCFLVSKRPDNIGLNIMILSWLTPVNNKGLFSFSINKRRFTNECLKFSSEFLLSIPCKGMEDLVLSVGKCSGRQGNKFNHLSKIIQTIPVFDSSSKISKSAIMTKPNNAYGALCYSDSDSEEVQVEESINQAEETIIIEQKLIGIKGSIAHLKCSIKSWTEADDEHHIVIAQIETATIDENYWNGKHFAPISNDIPPYLTFFGSQTFGYTCSKERDMYTDSQVFNKQSTKKHKK